MRACARPLPVALDAGVSHDMIAACEERPSLGLPRSCHDRPASLRAQQSNPVCAANSNLRTDCIREPRQTGLIRFADRTQFAIALILLLLRLSLSLERRAGVMIGRRVKVGACRPPSRVALTRRSIMTQSRQAKGSLSSQAGIMSCAACKQRRGIEGGG